MKDEFCKKILNKEIAICSWHAQNIDQQISECQLNMTSSTNADFTKLFIKHQDIRLAKLIKMKSATLNKKFIRLFQRQRPEPDFIYDEDSCVNLTKKTIPTELLILLSFGPKFRPPITKHDIQIPKYIADLEFAIETACRPENKEETRNAAINEITNFLNSETQQSKIEKFLATNFEKLIRFLRNNKDLMILNSDKSHKTVIMDHKTYDSKMKELLSDTDTYAIIHNPVNKLIRERNV